MPHRRPSGSRALARIAALILVAASACGHTSPGPGATAAGNESPTSSSPGVSPALIPISSRCPAAATDVRFRTLTFPAADGTQLYGAVGGPGPAGVVLANDVPHQICEEIAPATLLAKKGYLVLLFDYRGRGESAQGAAPGRLDLDVSGAVAELRALGVTHVVLFGSYGGVAAAVVATPAITPPVDALVGFSPAAYRGQYVNGPFDPEGALDAAPRLRLPVLYVTAQNDRFVRVSEATRLYRATGSQSKRLMVIPDGFPGWYLLDYEQHVQDTVMAFVASNT
jgi:alpha-beta hydrolase superfamily lysophospholipase